MRARIATSTSIATACLLSALLIGSSAASAGSLSAGASNSSSTSSSDTKSSNSNAQTSTGTTTEGPATNSATGAPAANSLANGQAATATPTATTQPLSSVSQPEQKLVSAQVQDSSGQPIGQVASVRTGDRGAPTSVQVSLNASRGGKVVSIGAEQLRYDSAKGVVVAQLSQAEINALASASAPPQTTR